jgi:hypothetical protein
MNNPTQSPWLSNALEALVAGDTDAWARIYSDDAVHEFPFAPPGLPGRLEGEAAITEYLVAPRRSSRNTSR